MWLHQLIRLGIFECITIFATQKINTGVAQLVEHWSPKPGVGSSSLSSRANKNEWDTTILYSIFLLFFCSFYQPSNFIFE
jgi:hypothetical protein